MASFYSIVQFVPDLVADERINIGAFTFGDGRVRCHFLGNWARVQRFSPQDISFLRDFARDMAAACRRMRQVDIAGRKRLGEDELRRMIAHWGNGIQFTQPRASLDTPDELLDEVAGRFLREPVTQRRERRDRRAAAGLAAGSLIAALLRRGADERTAEHLVQRHEPVAGKSGDHDFDVVLRNGVVYSAARALSFEIRGAEALSDEIGAAAWAIADVHRRDPSLPLGVVLLPPVDGSKTYGQAVQTFESLDAPILTEGNLAEWASGVVERLPEQALRAVPALA